MSSRVRAPRSDLLRNRALLLAAAREAFEADGADFSVDGVAARAGVGVGTFYRNFPTKSALLEAMIVEQLDALADIVDPEAGPAESVFAFIREALARAPAKLDLSAALDAHGADAGPDLQRSAAQLKKRVGEVLGQAQEAGTVRRELELDDLLALVSAAMTACARAGDSARRTGRIASILCDGLASSGRKD